MFLVLIPIFQSHHHLVDLYNNCQNQINQIYKEIQDSVKDLDLYFAIGTVDVKFDDFGSFNNIFSESKKQSDLNKKRKFNY